MPQEQAGRWPATRRGPALSARCPSARLHQRRPALARADVGLAIGTGTGVAIGAAGVTLMSGSLTALAAAIGISCATVRNIRQNLSLAFGYNTAGTPSSQGCSTRSPASCCPR